MGRVSWWLSIHLHVRGCYPCIITYPIPKGWWYTIAIFRNLLKTRDSNLYIHISRNIICVLPPSCSDFPPLVVCLSPHLRVLFKTLAIHNIRFTSKFRIRAPSSRKDDKDIYRIRIRWACKMCGVYVLWIFNHNITIYIFLRTANLSISRQTYSWLISGPKTTNKTHTHVYDLRRALARTYSVAESFGSAPKWVRLYVVHIAGA